MKYILCGVAALCLVYPFLSQSTVLAPEPTLGDLVGGATVSEVLYEVAGYEYRVVFTNNLVVSYRADGSFDYFYQEGN